MPTTPTPIIRNILELERSVKNLEFVHLTEEQWKKATKGLTVQKGRLGQGSAIECINTSKSGWLLSPRCGGNI